MRYLPSDFMTAEEEAQREADDCREQMPTGAEAIRWQGIQGDLDVAANYLELAAQTTDCAERVFFLERAHDNREAARKERARCQSES